MSDREDKKLNLGDELADVKSLIAGAEDGSARMGCLHDAEDLLLEIDCAISPLYTVGTAWKLRDTYLGAIRDPRGWFDFRGVYPKPVTVQ